MNNIQPVSARRCFDCGEWTTAWVEQNRNAGYMGDTVPIEVHEDRNLCRQIEYEKRQAAERRRSVERPHLFQLGMFTLHSGIQTRYKIDCDALTDGDLNTIVYMLLQKLPDYSSVVGVPTGGLRLAEKLKPYTLKEKGPLLIVDDVLTTGGSMEKLRDGQDAIGAVIFSRGPCPPWITPLFSMEP